MKEIKEKIKEWFLKKGVKEELFLISIYLILIIFFGFFVILLSTPTFFVIKNIVERNLILDDSYIFLYLELSFIILLAISSTYLIFSIGKLFKKTINWLFYGTIIIMFFTMISGLVIIDFTFGDRGLDLALRDVENNLIKAGNISCRDYDNLRSELALLVGDDVRCEINPSLTNISANVSFTFRNGSVGSQPMDYLHFKAPFDVKHVYFQIEGIDENRTKRKFSIGYFYTFSTNQEYEQKRREFIAYTFALFGIILFSVPSLVYNLRRLKEKPAKGK